MLFFKIITMISCAFSSVMNKNLCAAFAKICTSRADPLSLLPLLKCTTHLLTVLTATVLSPNVSECQWVPFFFTWRNSGTHLSFILTSMSDTIFSDCPSAAICCTATKCNGILVRRFNLCCYTANIYL